MSILATVYMRIFLKESLPNGDDIRQPILKEEQDVIRSDSDLENTRQVFKRIPSVGDLIFLTKNR